MKGHWWWKLERSLPSARFGRWKHTGRVVIVVTATISNGWTMADIEIALAMECCTRAISRRSHVARRRIGFAGRNLNSRQILSCTRGLLHKCMVLGSPILLQLSTIGYWLAFQLWEGPQRDPSTSSKQRGPVCYS